MAFAICGVAPSADYHLAFLGVGRGEKSLSLRTIHLYVSLEDIDIWYVLLK